MSSGKRHPSIKNNVVIGTHAIVLGPITIGENAVIGAGSVVVKNVLPNTTVAGVPVRIINPPPLRENFLDHGKIPDLLEGIQEEQKTLERELGQVKKLIEGNAHK